MSALPQPSFDITHETEPTGTVLAGFSEFGFAGLTAVDYLVDQLGLTETGHITARGLPTITPFENGRPRHHTRLFSRDDLDVTILVGELFVPASHADAFSRAVLEWIDAGGIDEIAVLSGVPVPHAPEEHRAFYVATDDYRRQRLEGVDLAGMGTGFLAGINGSLVARGIDTSLAAAVFVTPVHAQAPDVEAALRLLGAVETVYGLGVDTGPLESFAAEVQQHYRDLAERIEQARTQEVPEDRMYM